MDSSPPPNLANINQFFNQYDANQDGKVNDEEILKIFQDLGFTDIYIGTIRKVIRLMNVDNPSEYTLNFLQVQEFAEAMITKGKFKVWKTKLGINQELKLVLKELYGEQQSGGAGPGAAPSGGATAPTYGKQFNNQDGQITVNVGNIIAADQYINVTLEKQTGQQIKPFVKISVERNTHEEASKIETLFKSIYDTVIEILKAQQEQLISEILSVSFITSVNNNVFNLFITTANQSLIELAELFVSYIDLVVKNPINGKIQGSFKFNFDFTKFVTDPSYNFYDIFVKNSSFNLKWNLWEMFSTLRKFFIQANIFKEFTWDATHELSLFFIGFLHCERFVGKVEFNNTGSQGQETKSKEQLSEVLSQIRKSLVEMGQQTGMELVEMVKQLDGKIRVQVGVKDWRLNVQARLKNLVKVLTQEIQGMGSENGQNFSQNSGNAQIHTQPMGLSETLQKQSSQKSLKSPKKQAYDSDSQNSVSSMKKAKKVKVNAKEGSAEYKGKEIVLNDLKKEMNSSSGPESDEEEEEEEE